jgi:mannose-6-phosphate isomerase-like protein (cupin superfamily)
MMKRVSVLFVFVVLILTVAVSNGQTALPRENNAATDTTKGHAMSNADVLYFNHEQVDKTFQKGGVLYNGNPDRNYQVHAARKTEPGQVEVHAKDTDIFYVLDGSATFITGGTVVDGKTTAQDEIRGTSIRDGRTQKIGKGDVIIVPNGIPHWIQQVQGTLLYYVVKVR